MSEPDVTLTDYGLAIECAICAVLLGLTASNRKGLRTAGMCFFVSLGLGAVIGGTVHGFCPDRESPACALLWKLTLESVGLAAFSAWTLGANTVASGRAGHWLALAAIPQIVIYCPLAFLVTQEFWVAHAIYVPAALLLLAGFCRGGWEGHRFLLVGAAGSVLSLLSSFLQFMRIGIDPVYFNHNALAHVVQAVALALIYRGIRFVIGPGFTSWPANRPGDVSPSRT